jgi:hypothetical protein
MVGASSIHQRPDRALHASAEQDNSPFRVTCSALPLAVMVDCLRHVRSLHISPADRDTILGRHAESVLAL